MNEEQHKHDFKRQEYREQDGCHNCTRCFERLQYDEESTLYCTLNAPTRPNCMSVAMEECVYLYGNPKKYAEASAAWDKWSKHREVKPWRICAYYRKKILK